MSSYLAPGDDLSAIAAYCGIKVPTVALLADLAEDVAAATLAVEARCGPVAARSATVTLRTPRAEVLAPWRPSSLTSYALASGGSLDVADWVVDGYLVSRPGWAIIPAGTLTYATGYAVGEVPEPLMIVGQQMVRQLWRARIGNPRAEGEPGIGVLWTRQAEMLAAPYFLPDLGFS